jgi:hypothetical protein
MKLYRVSQDGCGWLFFLAECEDRLFAMLEEEYLFSPAMDKREEWQIVEYSLDEEYRLPPNHQAEGAIGSKKKEITTMETNTSKKQTSKTNSGEALVGKSVQVKGTIYAGTWTFVVAYDEASDTYQLAGGGLGYPGASLYRSDFKVPVDQTSMGLPEAGQQAIQNWEAYKKGPVVQDEDGGTTYFLPDPPVDPDSDARVKEANDALSAHLKTKEAPGKMKCPVCGGEGFGRGFDGDCPACGGTGKVAQQNDPPKGSWAAARKAREEYVSPVAQPSPPPSLRYLPSEAGDPICGQVIRFAHELSSGQSAGQFMGAVALAGDVRWFEVLLENGKTTTVRPLECAWDIITDPMYCARCGQQCADTCMHLCLVCILDDPTWKAPGPTATPSEELAPLEKGPAQAVMARAAVAVAPDRLGDVRVQEAMKGWQECAQCGWSQNADGSPFQHYNGNLFCGQCLQRGNVRIMFEYNVEAVEELYTSHRISPWKAFELFRQLAQNGPGIRRAKAQALFEEVRGSLARMGEGFLNGPIQAPQAQVAGKDFVGFLLGEVDIQPQARWGTPATEKPQEGHEEDDLDDLLALLPAATLEATKMLALKPDPDVVLGAIELAIDILDHHWSFPQAPHLGYDQKKGQTMFSHSMVKLVGHVPNGWGKKQEVMVGVWLDAVRAALKTQEPDVNISKQYNATTTLTDALKLVATAPDTVGYDEGSVTQMLEDLREVALKNWGTWQALTNFVETGNPRTMKPQCGLHQECPSLPYRPIMLGDTVCAIDPNRPGAIIGEVDEITGEPGQVCLWLNVQGHRHIRHSSWCHIVQ